MNNPNPLNPVTIGGYPQRPSGFATETSISPLALLLTPNTDICEMSCYGNGKMRLRIRRFDVERRGEQPIELYLPIDTNLQTLYSLSQFPIPALTPYTDIYGNGKLRLRIRRFDVERRKKNTTDI